MWKDKGIILIETLWAIFIFSVIILTTIPVFQQIIREREYRNHEYAALMIARSEMESGQVQLLAKQYQQNIYQIQVTIHPHQPSIVEVQVIVTWRDTKKEKKIYLTKLVYQNTG
ncbi:type II secretion system protein [Tepidibacillus marianensis]|uniref:type II secretion system protein n=1 Tax=Tepidibacillus marianensis TaxID=3131995 RepID=UPI0030D0546F